MEISEGRIQEETYRQVTDGNGLTTEETRGMTLRELVIDMRGDVKDLKKEQDRHQVVGHSDTLTIRQILAFVGAYTTILISLHLLVF